MGCDKERSRRRDAAIEKANRLVELLESADRILDRVVQKMGAAKDTEK